MAADERIRFSWMAFALFTVAIAAFAIFQGHVFLFGPPVIETGDFAANALEITDARSFIDIYGNYSRWGFNHPGPFFFYWYAAGEWLFHDLLHVVASAHQAHVLAGILLQSTLISAALAFMAGLSRRPFVPLLLLATAAAVLLQAGNGVSSIWMPHVLLGPYLLLIVSSAFVSLGDRRLLPVAVLMTCILCHGHVAQPLMTFPLLGIAIGGLVLEARRRDDGWAVFGRTIMPVAIVSMVIAAVFLVPLLVDAMRCPDCNVHRILAYMHQDHGKLPNWRQAVNSIAALFVFDHAPELATADRHVPWLSGRILAMLAVVCIASVSARLASRRAAAPGARHLPRVVSFAVLSLVLACVWAHRITGPLFEFNSYFVYAIYMVLAVATVTSLAMLAPRAVDHPGSAAVAAVLVCLVVAWAPSLPVFSQAYTAPNAAPDASNKGRVALLNLHVPSDWPTMAALAVWAHRTGDAYLVPPDWRFVYGWDHGVTPERIAAAGAALDIWEPGNAAGLMGKAGFSPDLYCHISDRSPWPPSDASSTLSASRKACQIAFYGLEMAPDAPFTWAVRGGAVMQVRARHTDGPVALELRAQPFLANGKLRVQRVDIRVNGRDVGTMPFSTDQVNELAIPAAVWNERPVATVEFAFPDAISPEEAGVSPDPRPIAVGMQGIGVRYPKDALPAP
ncbi:MAG TPA: hypothetical protein VGN46_16615 [Luteibacter sp.]|jgi:hypothetical protein|uniref:hypothetical protein n=1 Tax=Luteibacter sp. TaxID=1886636 RepID=UPI002F41E57E